MNDASHRGLCTINVSGTHARTLYGYCRKCARIYTVFTTRNGPGVCCRCHQTFTEHCTFLDIKKRRASMNSVIADSIDIPRYLTSVFYRTRVRTLRRWWTENRQRLERRSEFEILSQCFEDVSRSEVPRHRPRTFHNTLTYEIILACTFDEVRRNKYVIDGPIECHCGQKRSMNFMVACEQGHFMCVSCVQPECTTCGALVKGYRRYTDIAWLMQ